MDGVLQTLAGRHGSHHRSARDERQAPRQLLRSAAEMAEGTKQRGEHGLVCFMPLPDPHPQTVHRRIRPPICFSHVFSFVCFLCFLASHSLIFFRIFNRIVRPGKYFLKLL